MAGMEPPAAEAEREATAALLLGLFPLHSDAIVCSNFAELS